MGERKIMVVTKWQEVVEFQILDTRNFRFNIVGTAPNVCVFSHFESSSSGMHFPSGGTFVQRGERVSLP